MISVAPVQAGSGPFQVARHPVFGRVVAGLLISGFGDGLSLVAIPLSVLDIAGANHAAILIGVALACYQLPGAAVVFLLPRMGKRLTGQHVAAADGILRAVALGIVPLLALLHVLTVATLLILVSVSSLLCAWGIAGRFSFIADTLGARQRLAANNIALTGRQAASLVGSLLAAPLITLVGPYGTIGLDALTFMILGLSYARVAALAPRSVDISCVAVNSTCGFSELWGNSVLMLLVGVSVFFSLWNGVAQATVPLLSFLTWHGSTQLLSLFWTVAGCGAVLGGLAIQRIGRRAAWPTMVGIVSATGLTLIAVAAAWHPYAAIAFFGVATACASPMPALAFSMTQLLCPLGSLRAALAARSSLLLLSSPMGNALGGLITAVSDPRWAMASAGVAMVGGSGCAWLLGRRKNSLYISPDGSPQPSSAAVAVCGRDIPFYRREGR